MNAMKILVVKARWRKRLAGLVQPVGQEVLSRYFFRPGP